MYTRQRNRRKPESARHIPTLRLVRRRIEYPHGLVPASYIHVPLFPKTICVIPVNYYVILRGRNLALHVRRALAGIPAHDESNSYVSAVEPMPSILYDTFEVQ